MFIPEISFFWSVYFVDIFATPIYTSKFAQTTAEEKSQLRYQTIKTYLCIINVYYRFLAF